jgi:hypothetical protein
MVAVKGARMAAKKSFRILRKFARATRGLNKENPKPVGSLGDALYTKPKKVFGILRAFARATLGFTDSASAAEAPRAKVQIATHKNNALIIFPTIAGESLVGRRCLWRCHLRAHRNKWIVRRHGAAARCGTLGWNDGGVSIGAAIGG